MINFIGGFFLCDHGIIIDNVIVMDLAILLHATPQALSVKISVNNTDLSPKRCSYKLLISVIFYYR